MTGPLLDAVMVAVGATLALRTAAMVGLACVERVQRTDPTGPPPSIAVIVPAHDEEAVIAATIRGVAAAVRGLDAEIVVVDDGSTDQTAAIARALVGEVPALRVVSQIPNRGKVAALARGLAETTGEVVVTVDADTIVAEDALRRLATRFADPRVGAVAANIKVGNRAGLVGVWQSLEYVGGLNVDRRAQHWVGCITTVPGACGAWRRSAVEACGGFPADTLTEDTDLTVAMLRAGWRVAYDDRAVAWTEAPSGTASLFRQRTRWLHGNLQVAWKHADGLGRGRIGLLALPNLWFSHLGVYLVPVVATAWLLVRGPAWLGWSELAAVALVLLAIDLAVAAIAYGLDAERTRELVHLPAQRLYLPPLLWGVFATVLTRIALGARPEWARVARTGAVARLRGG